MTTLVTQQGGWPFKPDKCPFDQHLMEWLIDEGNYCGPIFHMGPGEHHYVGKLSAERGWPCMSITISVEEVESYMAWAIENPTLARHYQCLFADVQNLDSLHYPPVGLVSLPHLGEMPDPRRDEYGRTRSDVLRMFTAHLFMGGTFVFYTGSAGFGDIQADLVLLEGTGRFKREDDYKTLRVYRKIR